MEEFKWDSRLSDADAHVENNAAACTYNIQWLLPRRVDAYRPTLTDSELPQQRHLAADPALLGWRSGPAMLRLLGRMVCSKQTHALLTMQAVLCPSVCAAWLQGLQPPQPLASPVPAHAASIQVVPGARLAGPLSHACLMLVTGWLRPCRGLQIKVPTPACARPEAPRGEQAVAACADAQPNHTKAELASQSGEAEAGEQPSQLISAADYSNVSWDQDVDFAAFNAASLPAMDAHADVVPGIADDSAASGPRPYPAGTGGFDAVGSDQRQSLEAQMLAAGASSTAWASWPQAEQPVAGACDPFLDGTNDAPGSAAQAGAQAAADPQAPAHITRPVPAPAALAEPAETASGWGDSDDFMEFAAAPATGEQPDAEQACADSHGNGAPAHNSADLLPWPDASFMLATRIL